MTRWNRALPWIALGTIYLVWGSTYLGIRVAVTTIPPYLMTGCRYFVAGALLFVWQLLASRQRPAMPSRAEWMRILITGFLLLVVGNGLLCVAETRVESGTSALLLASTPIWMLLLDAWRTRRKPNLTSIGGVIVGSSGIAALVGKSAGHGDLLFACIILIASISWAAGTIYAPSKNFSPYTASLEMAAGGLLCSIVGLLAGEGSHLVLGAISGPSLWGMLWLITGGAMVGYSAYAYAIRTLPTATVATYAYVNPVVAVILGAAILREPITANVLAGGAAVVLSVILILVGNRPEREVAAEFG